MKYRLEWRRGEPVISGDSVDYVGGQLRAAWEEAFLSYGLIGRSWERVLLVGMGASLIQILARTGNPPPQKVIVLEKDPQMVHLQEAHFDLPLPYEVRIGDAAQTISEVQGPFDGICVDAFIEREVPKNLLELSFLQSLWASLSQRGILVWNVLLDTQASQVQALLEKLWPLVRLRRIGSHRFFLASWGEAGLPF